MIKVVLVLLAVAVIGGVSWLFLSPFLSPMISSAIPSLSGIVTTVTSQIQPVITYINENMWQVGGLVVGAGGFVAMISSKIHGIMMQKKEVETTIKQNDLQSNLFQAKGEVLGLQNQLEDAKSTITTLKENASNVAEITKQLKAKTREVETLQAEKNALERILPNIKTTEKMIEDKLKVE